MTAAPILIRADASVAMGTGHLMRCLALAQAWQDAGGRAVFAAAESTEAVRARLVAERCNVVSVSAAAGSADDASQTIALAHEEKAAWVVVDGYHFSADYQRALKAAGFKALFLDDYGHAQHYSADLLLNQNLGAGEALYRDREAQTRLLLGPRYCLLRREFAAWRSRARDVSPVCRKLLVMMGGSDPQNLTSRVLEALAQGGFENLEAQVVVGGSNPHFAALQSVAAQSAGKITVRRDVTNVAELMADADLAISAAGSTCWELFLFGLPALLVDVAANQTELAKELDRQGCAIRVGDQNTAPRAIAGQLERLVRSQEIRRSLSQNCRKLVDGRGAERVVSALRGAEGVRVRRAQAEDRRLLWEWANDPEVRAASFSSDAISWETHVAWFAEKLMPEKSVIFIAEYEDGNAAGQIRFDFRQDGEADVNLSLAKEKRGCGLAVPVIQAGVRELFATTECKRVHAFVKPENAASMRAFEKAGFVRIGADRIRDHVAVRFDLLRDLG